MKTETKEKKNTKKGKKALKIIAVILAVIIVLACVSMAVTAIANKANTEKANSFATVEYENQLVRVSEASRLENPVDEVSMPETVTWADTERDLSAWLSNSMQISAMQHVYELRDKILNTHDGSLISDWRYLTTSDHPYSMCTKYWNDGDVHAYFSAYASPYESFMYYMNVLRDIEYRIHKK